MNTSELQKIKQRYNIVGNSDGLNRALDIALQVAPTDLSVLIVGESGVGKEPLTAVLSLKERLTVNCLATRKARSQELLEKAKATLE